MQTLTLKIKFQFSVKRVSIHFPERNPSPNESCQIELHGYARDWTLQNWRSPWFTVIAKVFAQWGVVGLVSEDFQMEREFQNQQD